MGVTLPKGYRPTENEEFMNEFQKEYFKNIFTIFLRQRLHEADGTLRHLTQENLQQPDMADRAALETDHSIELRTRDRERKLIAKINAALERLADGSYGYCEETDEPIGVNRLEARPIATLSLEAQERHERMERTHRDD